MHFLLMNHCCFFMFLLKSCQKNNVDWTEIMNCQDQNVTRGQDVMLGLNPSHSALERCLICLPPPPFPSPDSFYTAVCLFLFALSMSGMLSLEWKEHPSNTHTHTLRHIDSPCTVYVILYSSATWWKETTWDFWE